MLGHQPHRPPGRALHGAAGAQGHSGETGGVPGDGPRAGVRGGGVRHLLRQPGPGLHTGAVPGEDRLKSVPMCHIPCQDSQLTQLVHNSSNSVPRWTLERLGPGKIYTARIYVSHVTGRSHPVIIKVATHKESSRFLILPPEGCALDVSCFPINISCSDDLEHRDFPEEREKEEAGSLPLPLKIIMLSLVMIALILVVFSASVGAICRIQCKVRI